MLYTPVNGTLFPDLMVFKLSFIYYYKTQLIGTHNVKQGTVSKI